MIKNKIYILPVHNGIMPFTFDENGNFYTIEKEEVSPEAMMAMKLEDLKEDRNIIIYNQSLELTGKISLSEVDQNLREIHNNNLPNEFPRFLFLDGENFVVSTNYNRCYVLDTNGKILTILTSEENNELQFFSSFFRTNDGRIICITKGKKYRDRYILGISKEKSPSFLSEFPFETSYLQDCWTYNELVKGNEHKELFPKNMNLNNHGKHDVLIDFVKNREEKMKENWDLNLGFRSQPYNIQLLQAIELSNDRILVSAFTDSEDKSAYPDKHTLFYFFIIDVNTGQILDEIAPYDTSIYKNTNYLIVEDKKNDRFLFKSEKAVYQISRDGILTPLISLEDRSFSKFRALNLIGNTGTYTYFHYRHASSYHIYEMIAIELGSTTDEMLENIKEFNKKWKEPS